MQKFHPLTTKIFSVHADIDVSKYDSIIRIELEKMAKQIEAYPYIPESKTIREILGLSTESEPNGWVQDFIQQEQKPKTAEAWCEKKYCSCCGNKLA